METQRAPQSMNRACDRSDSFRAGTRTHACSSSWSRVVVVREVEVEVVVEVEASVLRTGTL
jgi:hypothetical protein